MVKRRAELGKTVLLTTHYMEEAQYLADRVAIIADGRIVAEGPPGTLGGRDRALARIRLRLPSGLAPPDQMGITITPEGLAELTADDLTGALHRLTGWAIDQGVALERLEVIRPSLEDTYLTLTGATGAGTSAAERSLS